MSLACIARNNYHFHRLALLLNRCLNLRQEPSIVGNKEALSAVRRCEKLQKRNSLRIPGLFLITDCLTVSVTLA